VVVGGGVVVVVVVVGGTVVVVVVVGGVVVVVVVGGGGLDAHCKSIEFVVLFAVLNALGHLTVNEVPGDIVNVPILANVAACATISPPTSPTAAILLIIAIRLRI